MLYEFLSVFYFVDILAHIFGKVSVDFMFVYCFVCRQNLRTNVTNSEQAMYGFCNVGLWSFADLSLKHIYICKIYYINWRDSSSNDGLYSLTVIYSGLTAYI